MRPSLPFYALIALFFVCFIALAAPAQSIPGSTWITYDEATNTVTAYSETNVNESGLNGEYQAEVVLTVTKSTGGIAASGSMLDPWDGFASVTLQFQGEPGVTYTAVGQHRTRLNLWDYAPSFPYNIEYFDDWYFSSFIGQGINVPQTYNFLSPGFFQIRRTSQIIPMGNTYAVIAIPPPTVTITKADGTALSNPVRIGINGGGNDRKQSLKATVNPANQTAKSRFQTSTPTIVPGLSLFRL
jgi:hypothetical protein